MCKLSEQKRLFKNIITNIPMFDTVTYQLLWYLKYFSFHAAKNPITTYLIGGIGRKIKDNTDTNGK